MMQSSALFSKVLDEDQVQSINRWRSEKLVNLRSWQDFFDFHRFSRPNGLNGATARLNHNLVYYQTNYYLILVALLIYILITNWVLLFSVLFLAVGFTMVSRMNPTEQVSILNGLVVATQRQYYMFLGIIAVPLLWFSSAGSVLFWLIGVSGVVVLGHAIMMEPPIETAFEEEP